MKTTDNIEKMLTPQSEFKASAGLKDRILEAAAQSEPQAEQEMPKVRKVNFRRWISSCAAAVAVIAMILVFRPGTTPMYAASDFFHSAIEYFTGHPSFVATLEVRTKPEESFSYINIGCRFIRHTMAVDPQTGRWSLEKSGRKAVNDGQYIWQWVPRQEYGWKNDGTAVGVIDDFAFLLDPIALLKSEEAIAASSEGAVAKKSENDNTITLVVTSPAQGKYVDNVGLNTSILESDTRREYTFDKQTGRLMTLEIHAKAYGITRCVVKLSNIDYNTSIPQTLFYVPDDIRWTDNTTEGLKKSVEGLPVDEFAGLSAEETVKKMIEAMNIWDENVLKLVLRGSDLNAVSKIYRDCTLIECGESFRSGVYGGVYVPCKVKLSSGKEENLVIAMRKDNPWKVWINDGGL